MQQRIMTTRDGLDIASLEHKIALIAFFGWVGVCLLFELFEMDSAYLDGRAIKFINNRKQHKCQLLQIYFL